MAVPLMPCWTPADVGDSLPTAESLGISWPARLRKKLKTKTLRTPETARHVRPPFRSISPQHWPAHFPNSELVEGGVNSRHCFRPFILTDMSLLVEEVERAVRAHPLVTVIATAVTLYAVCSWLVQGRKLVCNPLPNHGADLHTRVIFSVCILRIRRGMTDGPMCSAPLLDVGSSARKRTKQYLDAPSRKHRSADRIVTAQSEYVRQSSPSDRRTGAS